MIAAVEISLPIRVNAINEAVHSHDATTHARQAWQQGEAGKVNGGIGCKLAFYLKYNIHAPRQALPQELIDTGKGILNNWSRLSGRCVQQYTRQIGFIPSGTGSVKHRLVKMWSEGTPDEGLQASEILDEAREFTARHPSSRGILDRQFAYEEQVLARLAPHYQDISPSEVQNNSYLVYKTEPQDIPQAIAEVAQEHQWTLKVMEGFTTHGGLTLARIDGLPRLLKQDGFFASLVPPHLLEEAWNMQAKLEDQLPPKEDESYHLAQLLISASSGSPEFYQKRVGFEARLLAALEAQKDGASIPGPTNKAELQNLVAVTNRWTQRNIKTFEEHDLEGWRGGFSYFYRWMERDEAMTHLPKTLADRGRNLWHNWQDLKREATSLAIRKTWGIDLDDIQPEDALKQLDEAFQQSSAISVSTHPVRARAEFLLLSDPKSLTRLKKQAKYETDLLRYLTSS